MLTHPITGDVTSDSVKVIPAKSPHGLALCGVFQGHTLEIRFLKQPFFSKSRETGLAEMEWEEPVLEKNWPGGWADLSLCVCLGFSFCITEGIIPVM